MSNFLSDFGFPSVPPLNLSLSDTEKSSAANSGGNQAVTVNGAAGALPANFWGTPSVFGGTSAVPGLGGSLSTGTLFLILGAGLALYWAHKKGVL